MAKPAQTMETTVEERIASLESHVQHIQADVTEVKASIQRLDQKIDAVDQRLSAKIDGVDQRLSAKVDNLKDSVAEFRLATEKSFSRLCLWALMLYIALAVALLGVMAKGFGWIK